MSEDIVGIPLNAYSGAHLCMGYPLSKRNHARADWWFETPDVVKQQLPAVDRVYLCRECCAEFMSRIAVGLVWTQKDR